MSLSTAKNLVRNPQFSGDGCSPDGWIFTAPRPELSPNPTFIQDVKGKRTLGIEAAGDIYAFGCWCGEAELEVGEWYHATVGVKVKGIEKPDISVCAQFAQHFLVPDGEWRDEMLLQQIFRINDTCEGNKIELYLRSSETGSVEWYDPCIVKIDPPDCRTARVATVRFDSNAAVEKFTLGDQQVRIAEKLEQAGCLRPDAVLLPEFSQVIGVDRRQYKAYYNAGEPVPDGHTCRLLSKAARRYGMYVIAGIIEKRDKYLFNTAVIFDRQGRFIGQYDKTHLTFNEMKEGFSCGRDYPVFDLDFGRIGIHICYDEWFPEVSRYYAHKNVEILFLPVAGGKPITWRTRALDNGIYFVSSSITPPSMIIDSSGAIIAETHGDGIAYADLNLDYRKVNYYMDPTLVFGMPCIVPQMRNTADNGLVNRLFQLMK